MAFVLAFARGLHQYLPRSAESGVAPRAPGHERDSPARGNGAHRRRGRHRRGAARLAAPSACRARRRQRAVGHPRPVWPASTAPTALDSLLPGADFVILTVPHNPRHEGFMNARRFQRMKRTAFFITSGEA